MCGIFGWQWHHMPARDARVTLATVLSLLNESRGRDSFGYATGHERVSKGMGPITEGVQPITLAKAGSLIAHTRYKTVGAKTKDNAHPFVIGPITGAHNGGIWNHWEMNKKYEREYEVDSMHIFGHIAHGHDLGELTGYGAIEYFDARYPRGIFIGKFGHGDLAVALVESHGVVWSSDRDHLARALKQAGLEWRPYIITNEMMYVTKGGRLYEAGTRIEIRGTKRAHQSYCNTGATPSASPYVAGNADDDEALGEYWRRRTPRSVYSMTPIEINGLADRELAQLVAGHNKRCKCNGCSEVMDRMLVQGALDMDAEDTAGVVA